MTASTPDLLARHSPDTPLANIPWEELPPPLQETCEQFLTRWWENMDPDQPIKASGLSDMTLAQVLTLHEQQE